SFLLTNNGNGTFQIPTPLPAGFGVYAAADLNGDGKPDLIGTGGSSVQELLGNGNGTFQAPLALDGGQAPVSILGGDFNGDGTPDLVVVDTGVGTGGSTVSGLGAGVSLLLGQGAGTFGPGTFYPLNYRGSGEPSAVAADVNKDGNLDLLFSGGRVSV